MSEMPSMRGKVILITGGTGGIGKSTAMGLAKLGGTVIIVGRDRRRGEAALAEIKQETGSGSVQLMLADLSLQKDIRELAGNFMAHYKRLDVLINNAGGLYGKRWESVDGIECTLAINLLCAFLLTQLLLPVLRASAPSRVVNVNSEGHRFTKRINFDDLQTVRWRRGFLVYSQAKLANLLFTYELAERLAEERITVNAVHPGIVETELAKRFFSERIFPNTKYISRAASFLAMKLSRLYLKFDDIEKAAESCIYLAASPEVEGVSGKYFNNEKQIVLSSAASYDKTAALRLWQVSGELTGREEAAFATSAGDPCHTGPGSARRTTIAPWRQFTSMSQ